MSVPDRPEPPTMIWACESRIGGWRAVATKQAADRCYDLGWDTIPYIPQSELDAANAKIAALELCLQMAEQDAKDWKEQHRSVFVERDTLRKELEEARATIDSQYSIMQKTAKKYGFTEGHIVQFIEETVNGAISERDAALAEVKKLKSALHPFVIEAGRLDVNHPDLINTIGDSCQICQFCSPERTRSKITYGDLRSLLSAPNPEKSGEC